MRTWLYRAATDGTVSGQSRVYRGPEDLRLLQAVAREVWRHDPRTVDVGGTVGEIAWSLAGLTPGDVWSGHIWLDDGDPLAWATLQWEPEVISRPGEREARPDTLEWQTRPAHVGLLDEILDWAESEATTHGLAASARAANTAAVASLESRGYAVDRTAPWNLLNVRPLDHIPEPVVPDGHRLTTMAELDDVVRRVAVHRAAWDGSTMSERRYRQIMRTWPYRADLDCVVEAPSGELVASALAWYDPGLGVGELEPVGTHRDHRRKGIARAVNLYALHRLKAAGATEAIVACRGDADYPAPKQLYESVGFRELSRQVAYVRRLR